MERSGEMSVELEGLLNSLNSEENAGRHGCVYVGKIDIYLRQAPHNVYRQVRKNRVIDIHFFAEWMEVGLSVTEFSRKRAALKSFLCWQESDRRISDARRGGC